MKSAIAATLFLSASVLASCAGTPTTSTGAAGAASNSGASSSEASTDPNFGAKCIQRIKAGLTNPNAADIALSGGGDELLASVTTTNPDNGQKAQLNYICKRDQERAVTAKLIAD